MSEAASPSLPFEVKRGSLARCGSAPGGGRRCASFPSRVPFDVGEPGGGATNGKSKNDGVLLADATNDASSLANDASGSSRFFSSSPAPSEPLACIDVMSSWSGADRPVCHYEMLQYYESNRSRFGDFETLCRFISKVGECGLSEGSDEGLVRNADSFQDAVERLLELWRGRVEGQRDHGAGRSADQHHHQRQRHQREEESIQELYEAVGRKEYMSFVAALHKLSRPEHVRAFTKSLNCKKFLSGCESLREVADFARVAKLRGLRVDDEALVFVDHNFGAHAMRTLKDKRGGSEGGDVGDIIDILEFLHDHSYKKRRRPGVPEKNRNRSDWVGSLVQAVASRDFMDAVVSRMMNGSDCSDYGRAIRCLGSLHPRVSSWLVGYASEYPLVREFVEERSDAKVASDVLVGVASAAKVIKKGIGWRGMEDWALGLARGEGGHYTDKAKTVWACRELGYEIEDGVYEDLIKHDRGGHEGASSSQNLARQLSALYLESDDWRDVAYFFRRRGHLFDARLFALFFSSFFNIPGHIKYNSCVELKKDPTFKVALFMLEMKVMKHSIHYLNLAQIGYVARGLGSERVGEGADFFWDSVRERADEIVALASRRGDAKPLHSICKSMHLLYKENLTLLTSFGLAHCAFLDKSKKARGQNEKLMSEIMGIMSRAILLHDRDSCYKFFQHFSRKGSSAHMDLSISLRPSDLYNLEALLQTLIVLEYDYYPLMDRLTSQETGKILKAGDGKARHREQARIEDVMLNIDLLARRASARGKWRNARSLGWWNDNDEEKWKGREAKSDYLNTLAGKGKDKNGNGNGNVQRMLRRA